MDRMDPRATPLGGAEQMVVCPNCGNRQAMSGTEGRCDRCGTLFSPVGVGQQGIVNPQVVGQADPVQVPPPMVAGGIGGVNDGTQVTHDVPTAVPGKPMAPIADTAAGVGTLEAQAMDTPSSAPSAKRGGSGA